MSDEEGDPFEQFEDVEDREGDPFETLDQEAEDAEDTETDERVWDPDQEEQLGGGPADPEDVGAGPSDEPETTDGATEADLDDGTAVDSGSKEGITGSNDPMDSIGPSTGTEEDPFGDVDEREGNPFESAESAFERMDVTELDPDEVWETLSEKQKEGSVADAHERNYAEVSKHTYCEQCEFFSRPPEVSCSNDGTEILEFIDTETVRVVDCPVVAERKELEEQD